MTNFMTRITCMHTHNKVMTKFMISTTCIEYNKIINNDLIHSLSILIEASSDNGRCWTQDAYFNTESSMIRRSISIKNFPSLLIG